MDYSKTLARIEAYAATVTGGVPGNEMNTSVHINIRFLRWAAAQGFEHEKSAYTKTVTILYEPAHVRVLAMVNSLVGKYPVGTYLMSQHPLLEEMSGHRVDQDEAETGVALAFKGASRNMIKVNEDELAKWLAARRPKFLAKRNDGSFAFSLPDPGDDLDFKLNFGIG